MQDCPFKEERFSMGRFNMDKGDGSIKPLPRYSYEHENGTEYDVVKDTAGGLMCSIDSGPWREFRNDMYGAVTFAAIILRYGLQE